MYVFNAGTTVLQARKERGEGVAPRRNNRITESATKESREEKVEAKKAIQESNGKRQDERTNDRERNKECVRLPRKNGFWLIGVIWHLVYKKTSTSILFCELSPSRVKIQARLLLCACCLLVHTYPVRAYPLPQPLVYPKKCQNLSILVVRTPEY